MIALATAAVLAASWTPHPGARLPDLTFRDEANRPTRLSTLWRRPLLLTFIYASCPNLCTTELNALTHTLVALPRRAGRDFDVVAVSLDPADTPAEARRLEAAYTTRYGSAEGWHFLTGAEPDIARLAATVGYGYVCEPRAHAYVHPAGVVTIAAGGTVNAYLEGLTASPPDVERALATPGFVTGVLLRCYHAIALDGPYGARIQLALKGTAIATVLALAALIGALLRKERRAVAK